jgi:hypothetical protein
MGQTTGISWSKSTFSPWLGCTKVSAGCDNCYAERITNEGGDNFWGPDARRLFTSDRYWSKPLDWNRTAREAGQRRQVFCSSMSDWAEGRPDQTRSRERLWQLLPERHGWIGFYSPSGPRRFRRCTRPRGSKIPHPTSGWAPASRTNTGSIIVGGTYVRCQRWCTS